MLKLIGLTLLTFGQLASAQVLVFSNNNKQVQPLSSELLKFVSDTLHTNKVGLHLNCDVKVREMTEDRKFSDGVKRVEMIEVIFRSKNLNLPPETIYFPVGSTKLTREQKVSKFSGPVEEIQLEAEDLVNSRFIFQHNGRGELVWMSYEDDLKTSPCALSTTR